MKINSIYEKACKSASARTASPAWVGKSLLFNVLLSFHLLSSSFNIHIASYLYILIFEKFQN